MSQTLRADRPIASVGPVAELDGSDAGAAVVLMSTRAGVTDPPLSGERMQPPNVELLPDDFALVIEGDRVVLTRTQYSIFAYFYENIGHWVTPQDLIRQVLGTHHQPDTSLVRVHVHAIRRRLGRAAVWLESDPRRIRGYRWGAPRDVIAPEPQSEVS